jgi:predicted membrane GTPase involved in stress response
VREKQKTNIRTHSHDDAIKLPAPKIHTLESAIEFIAEDELVEVTPPTSASASGSSRNRTAAASSGSDQARRTAGWGT